MDVTSVMRRAATFFANREAIVHGNDRLTFAEAWTRGCRMATADRARAPAWRARRRAGRQFHTNGYLYLLDRADDMIISGGFNIGPAELENAIASHPVAVFGVPDTRWGETPLAVVVPKPEQSVDEAAIVQLCIDQLGSYRKPGRVVIRDEPLPKTPVGKIKRKELREPYWKGQPRRVAGS